MKFFQFLLQFLFSFCFVVVKKKHISFCILRHSDQDREERMRNNDLTIKQSSMIFMEASFSCLWRTKFDCTIFLKEYVENVCLVPFNQLWQSLRNHQSSRLIPSDQSNHILLPQWKLIVRMTCKRNILMA